MYTHIEDDEIGKASASFNLETDIINLHRFLSEIVGALFLKEKKTALDF